MQKTITIKLLPSEAADGNIIKETVAGIIAAKSSSITGYNILKRSIDARGRNPHFQLTLNVFINEPFQERELIDFNFPNVKNAAHQVIIIGAGPAGLFAALKLIELGIKPIILERGKDVRARRRDLAQLNKEGIINPESNYCFGEGGAGTYSDGKLCTRSSKRGDVNRILNLFVRFGAGEEILYEAHPHIGTNKLPGIITAMRKLITDRGGEILFNKKMVDFIIAKDIITKVITEDGDEYRGEAVILATGHSARDIFRLLHQKNILIQAKPFALGVRVEHPQSLIDSSQYHCQLRSEFLPPSSYSWVQQVQGKGVFSFCMCPGGIIAPAATDTGELVVNGWSPSKRNNPFANSGIVVSVETEDAINYFKHDNYEKISDDDPLLLMKFQQRVEAEAFQAGGGHFVAPAQRLVDFTSNKLSDSLPSCSYLPGISSVELDEVLPSFIYKRLQTGFKEFGKKMKGYLTNDAVVVATESRTSSPVRIPREQSFNHPQLLNLYPCGEGAGYAGGIVSAAMDGEKVGEMIAAKLKGL
jgi:uncharacterized FAD-dependent dehydrogenase